MKRVAIPLAALTALALTLGALTGCASQDASLSAGHWRLSAWTVSSIDPADVTITASFADGRISGNSGVNSYSGTCTLGPGGTFAVGELASTLMAGPEPAMRAEQMYATLLAQARSYKVDGATLTLYDANGNESLVFRAADK